MPATNWIDRSGRVMISSKVFWACSSDQVRIVIAGTNGISRNGRVSKKGDMSATESRKKEFMKVVPDRTRKTVA